MIDTPYTGTASEFGLMGTVLAAAKTSEAEQVPVAPPVKPSSKPVNKNELLPPKMDCCANQKMNYWGHKNELLRRGQLRAAAELGEMRAQYRLGCV